MNLLRKNKYLSRIELSRKTGLDAKTITNAANSLLRSRLIRSRGFSPSGGGRPREKLELNPAYGYSVGIDLGASHLTGILTDFQVSVLSRHELEIKYGEGRDSIIEKIKELIFRLIRDAGVEKKKILGIGSGIISQGKLHYGVTLSAGEIGHTIVEMGGRKCRCGNRGCLETVASGAAIRRIVLSELRMGKKSAISDMVDGKFSRITACTVSEAAGMGDRLAIKTLRKAGEYLGVAVANLINILNPSTIIIGGRLAEAGKSLIDPMKESIRRYAIRHSANAVEILQSGLGDDAGALGGVTLVLNKIFE